MLVSLFFFCCINVLNESLTYLFTIPPNRMIRAHIRVCNICRCNCGMRHSRHMEYTNTHAVDARAMQTFTRTIGAATDKLCRWCTVRRVAIARIAHSLTRAHTHTRRAQVMSGISIVIRRTARARTVDSFIFIHSCIHSWLSSALVGAYGT